MNEIVGIGAFLLFFTAALAISGIILTVAVCLGCRIVRGMLR